MQSVAQADNLLLSLAVVVATTYVSRYVVMNTDAAQKPWFNFGFWQV